MRRTVLPTFALGLATIIAGSGTAHAQPWVSPSWPAIQSTRAPLTCQYDVTGAHKRVITVGLALGQAGHGERVVVERVRGGAAWAAVKSMPASGYVIFHAPFDGGAGTRNYVSVAGVPCERT